MAYYGELVCGRFELERRVAVEGWHPEILDVWDRGDERARAAVGRQIRYRSREGRAVEGRVVECHVHGVMLDALRGDKTRYRLLVDTGEGIVQGTLRVLRLSSDRGLSNTS